MDAPDQSRYVLGHAEGELERLRVQAGWLEPITRGFLLDAGLTSGMRVLDVGSGAGDVSFLAADLVGTEGRVIGVDRSPAAVANATARASEFAFDHVSFRAGDPTVITFDQPFDAVIGRYVLEFQADPAAMLRGLRRHVRPGGIIAFHELDCGTATSFPTAALYDRCWTWWMTLLPQTRADPRIGTRLFRTFVEAGLDEPDMRIEAMVGGGAKAAAPLCRRIAELIASVVDDLERLGVATAEEIGIETLGDRLVAEAIENQSVIVGPSQYGAWVRV